MIYINYIPIYAFNKYVLFYLNFTFGFVTRYEAFSVLLYNKKPNSKLQFLFFFHLFHWKVKEFILISLKIKCPQKGIRIIIKYNNSKGFIYYYSICMLRKQRLMLIVGIIISLNLFLFDGSCHCYAGRFFKVYVE